MKKPTSLVLLIAGIALSWQLMYWVAGANALTSPATTVVNLARILGTPEAWGHIGETGKALGYALLIATIGGIAFGVLLGLNRMPGLVVEPILLNLYSIPKVTLYPLVLLVFGLGLSAKVAFGVMHGLIPILMFTMNAIRQMRPVYLRAAGTMHPSRMQKTVHVVLPAIVPEVVTGLRLGFSLTLLGVLIGEMFASQRGVGYLITNAMNLGDIATIMALALFLTTVAVCCNSVFLMFNRRMKHG